MKKYFALLILLFAGFALAACIHETGGSGISQPDLRVAAPLRIETDGLQVSPTSSNGFGVSFLVRNSTGNRLYYNDDFRLNSEALSERNNPAGLQFLNHGDTKDAYVSWGSGELTTGMHSFERDFFLDAELTELYTTLAFEFDVVRWYHFTEDPQPIPEDLQAHREEQERDRLAFQIAGGASQIIVPASEVAVSRTGIAFNTVNLSTLPFIHGMHYQLLVYENGWKPAPAVTDSFAVVSIGFGMCGGQITEDRFDFRGWYGELENGHYMLMRNHHIDNVTPGAPRVQEILMVAFTVDDNTPLVLDDTEPEPANISIYADEITPTGLRLDITNGTSFEVSHNAPVIVQKYVYGVWENIYELNTPGRFQLPVPAEETATVQIDWAERFGKLPPGRYQLTAHFFTRDGGALAAQEFYIPQEPEYTGDTQLNPMFRKNVVAADVAVTPTGMTIRWENISDRVFYTPWPGYWVENYSPEEGRGPERLHEGFTSEFSGPYAEIRTVTIDIPGGGSWTYDTTALHPGQHVYQTIDWEGELPAGQYVISLEHFSPYEPGFMYWIRSWERFTLAFEVE